MAAQSPWQGLWSSSSHAAKDANCTEWRLSVDRSGNERARLRGRGAEAARQTPRPEGDEDTAIISQWFGLVRAAKPFGLDPTLQQHDGEPSPRLAERQRVLHRHRLGTGQGTQRP